MTSSHTKSALTNQTIVLVTSEEPNVNNQQLSLEALNSPSSVQ
jgi:hypothetical protein